MVAVVFSLRRRGVNMKEIPEKIKNIPSKISKRVKGNRGFDNPGYGVEFQKDDVTLDFPEPNIKLDQENEERSKEEQPKTEEDSSSA